LGWGAEVSGDSFNQGVLRRLIQLGEAGAHLSPEFATLMLQITKTLLEQPPARQTVVLGVLDMAFEAYDQGEESCHLFLLQVVVILTAALENTGMAQLKEVAGSAKTELLSATH
jgi:hypothetical protein